MSDFKELIKGYATEDLQIAAKDLLSRLNESSHGRGGLFDGLAACYAIPLADVLAEIGARKRYKRKVDGAGSPGGVA